MQQAQLVTKAGPALVLFRGTTGQATGTITPLRPVSTDPSAMISAYTIHDGVIQTEGGASQTTDDNYVKVFFFGKGTAGQTFRAVLTGWQLTVSGNDAEWFPFVLADLTVTLGSMSGSENCGTVLPGTAHLMGGTISVNGGQIVNNYVLEPNGNGLALLKLDLAGYSRLQLQVGTGSASFGNALMAGF